VIIIPVCVCSVLKVGVACMDDARYLLRDYKLDCAGCVDLRHLVPRTLPYANTYAEYCTLIPLPVKSDLCNLFIIYIPVITAQCTLVHMHGLGIACRPSELLVVFEMLMCMSSVCLSVCDVGDL